ncbi:MAG: DoxX family protein [Acidobacteriota bacterium]
MTSSKLFRLFTTPGYNLMRIFFGLLFACHGAQKLFGVFGRDQADNALMWAAGSIEFFGGLAIGLGLWTSVFAALAAGEMLVGYFMAHSHRALLPIENGGEPALLYFFAFLFIMSRGGDRWSLDSWLGKGSQ